MSKRRMITNKEYKNIYVAMPTYIYELTDISATGKIVLAWIHGYKNKINYITTATIADILNMSVSAINTVIKRLVFLEYITEKYYNGRRRTFVSQICQSKTEDIISLITTDILHSEVSSTYKITAGIVANHSLGADNFLAGYNYNNVRRLAKILGLSISSTYRHITELINYGLLARNNESRWLLQPKDTYSLSRVAIQNKRKSTLIKSGRLKPEQYNIDPPVSNTGAIEYYSDFEG